MDSMRPQVKFDFDADFSDSASIKVIGVGGAGGNAITRMIEAGLTGVDFIAINTDAQVLSESKAIHRIQIGRRLTKGLGSGGDPETGRRAVEEDLEAVAEVLHGADMVFVTAGLGGGTGTGASPTVARLARELGALTVGVVTKPFLFEGRQRARAAERGMAEMRAEVDTLITIPNQRLFEVVDLDLPFTEAFRIADDVLLQATRGISELITVTGLINLDFADVKSVMAGMGPALMGTGRAAGADRAEQAARQAIACPLLQDQDITGAQGVLINLTGSSSMSLREVTIATDIITEAVGDDANIIFGTVLNETLKDELLVTVIATGFGLGREDYLVGTAEAAPSAPRTLASTKARPAPHAAAPRAMAAAAAAGSAAAGTAAATAPAARDEAPNAAAALPDVESAPPLVELGPYAAREVADWPLRAEAVAEGDDDPLDEQDAEEADEAIDEVLPLLRGEVDAMRAEVLPQYDAAAAAADDLDVPTFLRKQSD